MAIPNVFFDPIDVTDSSLTPFKHSIYPGGVSYNFEVITNLEPPSVRSGLNFEDFGFDLASLNRTLHRALENYSVRFATDELPVDYRIRLTRIEGTPQVSLAGVFSKKIDSPFLFEEMLTFWERISTSPSFIQDGFVYLQRILAPVLANHSEPLPTIMIKLDDLGARTLDPFEEVYRTLLPFIFLAVFSFCVLRVLHHSMGERISKRELALKVYGVPVFLNSSAWTTVLLLEVVSVVLWVTFLFAMSGSLLAHGIFPDDMDRTKFLCLLLLFSIQHSTLGICCMTIFRHRAPYVFFGAAAIEFVHYTMSDRRFYARCTSGSTNVQLWYPGLTALAFGFKFSLRKNLPIIADRLGLMACAGRGQQDTLNYTAMMYVQVVWILIFMTIATIGSHWRSEDDTFRTRLDMNKSTSQFLWLLKIFSSKSLPSLSRVGVPLIQDLPEKSKLALVMKDVSYANSEGSVVLDQFTLVVPRGQIVSVVGEVQDVGEYLIAILAGICRTNGGVVSSFRCKLDQRAIGLCPVDFFLFDEMTLLDNAHLFLSYRTTQDVTSQFSYLLLELGVTAVVDDFFMALSRSDKRKVCIVVALMAAMDVIVLEEPTRDLTLEDTNKLAVLLHREQRNRSVLIITSDSRFAEMISERINICLRGQVVYSGSVTAVAKFLGLSPSIIIHLKLPASSDLRYSNDPSTKIKRASLANFSLLKILRVISEFHDGVRPLQVSRHRIVLQTSGSERQVEDVYEFLRTNQAKLNIQKIEMCEPGLSEVLDSAAEFSVKLSPLGEFRQLDRVIKEKWESCKSGLQTQGEKLIPEILLYQCQRTARMGFYFYTSRSVFALMIIVTGFIIMGHTLSSALHKPRYPEQLNSFRKIPYGIFCDAGSLGNAHNSGQILARFADYQLPAVTPRESEIGQICLQVTEDRKYILHGPLLASGDLFVFLGRLYNSFFERRYQIRWFWDITKQQELYNFLVGGTRKFFKELQFDFTLFASMLISTDLLFVGRTSKFYAINHLEESGLPKVAFWFGLIAFVIVKNCVCLMLFEAVTSINKDHRLGLSMSALEVSLKYCRITEDARRRMGNLLTYAYKSLTQLSTMVLGVGQTTIMTTLLSMTPVVQSGRDYPLILVLIFFSSTTIFYLETFIFVWAHDELASHLVHFSILLPAYHLAYVFRRLKFPRVLSKMCSSPEISEIICLTHPQYADLCCRATCPEGDNQCEKWDADAFSDHTGIGRAYLASNFVLLNVAFFVFLTLTHFKPSQRSSAERQEQMRLQKRRGQTDEFAEMEKQTVADVDPKTWHGILVRGLCFYDEPRFVLKDINFGVSAGEMFGVFGKRGSGRTSLLKALAGMIKVEESSEIYIGKHRVPLRFRYRSLIGYAGGTQDIPQNLTVRAYLEMFMSIREVTGAWQQYHLSLTLKIFSLTEYQNSNIGSLSESKKKLVSVASAFVGIPTIILLDDPLEDVDRKDRSRIVKAVNSLKSRDSVIVITSCNLDDAALFEFNRAAVLVSGEFVTIRTLSELLASDTSYHVMVRLNVTQTDNSEWTQLERIKELILSLLKTRFPEAKLIVQAGLMCEFHVRGEDVSCRRIHETKRVIIDTLSQAREIKIGHASGKRRLMYLIDALTARR
ncbi:uncharacterized protein LOC100900973 [Galendromus occidentalis]|uniref:Uncharacterized protein LOC100900973 n=1 Tax=Galendromus occidentalis TaxID=34638 RepID=A0AAJ7WHH4_9ACAR|nr:uncharacterized protein LOC100900973 [Galendromus occidentalis]